MRSRRFWLRPKWVFGHVLCLALIIVFVNMGFWQLRRLDEKQARNARIDARMRSEPVPLDEALAGGADDAEFRRVALTGRWDVDATVLVRSRALEGQPGYHAVTPLVTGDGAVLVNRGFVPIFPGGEARILDEARPDDRGSVEVEGIVRASEVRGSIGPTDRAGEALLVMNRIDVGRLQDQVDTRLAPIFVQLTAPEPEPGSFPIVLPEPATSEGSHFAYAMQWFIFSTVGAVGWPLLLRKTAKEQEQEQDEGAASV